MSRASTKQAVETRDLRHRILTCMTKLSDRDTHALAVTTLESIIPTLSPHTFSLFITSLSSTSTADRSTTRAASLRLLATLATTHTSSLTSHLPKLISAVIRRLRDQDSAVRSSAALATAAFAANITNSSFATAFLRPFGDSLATEQDVSAQSAAAICLSAAVDASPEIDPIQIVKMLPKWIKLLKCEGFKAKSSLLGLIRSAVRVCEIGNCNLLRDLVNCVMEFLKCEDWAVRKAVVDVLKVIATEERDSLSEFKAPCLNIFESRKFDKVKAVRDAMIEMVEVLKEIPDVVDDGSPPHSQASSQENACDGRYPAKSKFSSVVNSNTPEPRRKHLPLRRSSPSDSTLKTTAGNRGSLDFVGKKSGPSVTRKPSGGNAVTTNLHGSSATPACRDNSVGYDKGDLQRANVRMSKPDTRRSLFNKDLGTQVVPDFEEHSGAETCTHQKDCEDISLIRKQLVQIENQQSSLVDLLQKFIGSSQDSMRSLETRVQGLELALEDVSRDLALTTARITRAEPSRTSCCLLPTSDFFRSKFWKRPDGRFLTSRFSFSGRTPSVSAMHSLAEKSPASNTFKLENRRFRRQGDGGVVVNPLAEIHSDSRTPPVSSSSRVLKNVHRVA